MALTSLLLSMYWATFFVNKNTAAKATNIFEEKKQALRLSCNKNFHNENFLALFSNNEWDLSFKT